MDKTEIKPITDKELTNRWEYYSGLLANYAQFHVLKSPGEQSIEIPVLAERLANRVYAWNGMPKGLTPEEIERDLLRAEATLETVDNDIETLLEKVGFEPHYAKEHGKDVVINIVRIPERFSVNVSYNGEFPHREVFERLKGLEKEIPRLSVLKNHNKMLYD